MAITTTIISRISLGNRTMITGKSVLSGTATSGDVAVPLKDIEAFYGHEKASAQKGFAVNEDFPLRDTNPTVHIETTDGTFYWTAVGK